VDEQQQPVDAVAPVGDDAAAAPASVEAEAAEAVPPAADRVRNRHLVRLTFGIAIGVVLLDQLTKWLAVRYLEGQDPIELLGGLVTLTFLRNPGAAFSFGTGFTFVFTAIALGVSIFIVRKSRELGSIGWAIALGGLLGGAVGNLIDRVFRAPGLFQGHVVDFITFPNFAVFNLADSAIVCSSILMVLLALRGIELDGSRK
jgi:signal peptidase II